MRDLRRILVIDDDQEIVLATSLRLRASGYDVLTAQSGREGLRSAIVHHPDAIVLDVRMPGMDGLTTLARLREREETRRIPVVMLSASLVDKQKALEEGARYFLDKPYDARTLLAAVEAAITGIHGGRGGKHDGVQLRFFAV